MSVSPIDNSAARLEGLLRATDDDVRGATGGTEGGESAAAVASIASCDCRTGGMAAGEREDGATDG